MHMWNSYLVSKARADPGFQIGGSNLQRGVRFVDFA